MPATEGAPGAIPTHRRRALGGGRSKAGDTPTPNPADTGNGSPDAEAKPNTAPEGTAGAPTEGATPPAGSSPDVAAGAVAPVQPVTTGEKVVAAMVSAPETTAPTTRIAADGFDLSGLGDCGLDFVVNEDVPLSDTKPKILVYGDSGAGKTHFATNYDGVAVALVEPQGFATIRRVGRKVLVPSFVPKDPTKKALTPRLKTMEHLRQFVTLASSGRLAAAGVKILVFDSLTEIQQLMIDEIMAPAKAEHAKKAKERAEQGKTATPEMQKQDWGTLATMMRNFLRTIRDLPYIVVVLALTKPNEEEGTGVRRIYPNLSGSAQDNCPAYFNIVGFLYKSDAGAGKVRRLILVDGDERYYTKSYGPITGIVEADLGAWIKALDGDAAATVKAEGARVPGAKRRTLARGTTTAPVAPETPAGGETEEEED